MVVGYSKIKRKSLAPSFLFVLTLLFFRDGNAASYNDVVVPSDDIIEHCVLAGCDNQFFYKFYYKNRVRFCSDARTFISRKEHFGVLNYVINKSISKGLPGSFAMIPIMESSLISDAVAKDKKGRPLTNAALGLWQFKPSTARDMGLIVSGNIDERLDLSKSTEAGLRYLNWLADKFDGDVNLSILAYHAGVGRVERTSKKYKTKNAWLISNLFGVKYIDKDYLLKFHSYVLALTNKGC